MALKDKPRRAQRQERVEESSGSGQSQKPVWNRRYWTGSGSVEVAVFEHVVDYGNNPFATYSVAAKRRYKDGEQQYKSTRSFRAEDLLALAHGLTEAFSWISGQEAK